MPDNKVLGLPVDKKTAYIGGGGIVIVVALWYRQKQTAQNAAAATANAGDNTGIDPATGYPYGSAEDAAALGNQNSYISPVPQPYPNGTVPVPATPGPGSFTNNAQWAQYVEQYLVNESGADAATVGNAIGKYITGQPLTTDTMISVVTQAIAIGGYPPVAGQNGNPPHYITSHSGTTPPPSTTVHVPQCVGKTAGTAHNLIHAAGLVPVGDPGQKATKIVKSTTPKGGTAVAKGSTVLIVT